MGSDGWARGAGPPREWECLEAGGGAAWCEHGECHSGRSAVERLMLYEFYLNAKKTNSKKTGPPRSHDSLGLGAT